MQILLHTCSPAWKCWIHCKLNTYFIKYFIDKLLDGMTEIKRVLKQKNYKYLMLYRNLGKYINDSLIC